jgi:NAD(P)-dependent dehydrogenase (short-subunit alcohol dehydrogenase family)
MPLLRQNQGRAVNVGSVGAWNFSPGFGVYHVVKAAVHAETMVLRKEMAKFGVAVSLIEPGWYPSGSTLDLIR